VSEKSGSDSGGNEATSAADGADAGLPAPYSGVEDRRHHAAHYHGNDHVGQLPQVAFARMPDTRVIAPTTITQGWTSQGGCRNKSAPRGSARRAACRAEEILDLAGAMRMAAPAVKPMMTVCEMKLTSMPSRARPSPAGSGRPAGFST